jgi:DNA-binding CsgD family transcriptional regulator
MLLGRDREQRELERLLATARGGESAVLALVGEPGIGKSALLDYTAEEASDLVLLRARGVVSESQIPFAGLFELLRPALGYLDRIPEPQAAALESALALRPARAENRFAVGAATLSLLAACADTKPLAVLVDDVHWLDGSTADALLFAIRRLLAEPIAVVVSARDNEPSFLDGADLPTLQLAGLDPRAAAELIGDDADAARLHRETGGNPLALLELAQTHLPETALDVPAPVVTSVAAEYLERARALPPRTQDTLVLAAATDRGDLALLARAAATLGLEVRDLDPAVPARLVDLQTGRIEFRHPLARSAIYGAASNDRRREVHRALAHALPDADADRRAWHLALAAAGPDDIASSALEQAAARAHERSAYDVASQAYERAALLSVDDERRTQLLVSAADAAWLGGRADRSLRLLEGTHGDVAGDSLRGHIAIRQGPLREGLTLLAAAADRAEPEDAVVMLAEAVQGAFFSADAAAMQLYAQRARECATGDGELTAFFGDMASGMALVLEGQGDRGLPLIRGALELLEHSDALQTDPRLWIWAAHGPLWLRDRDFSSSLITRTEEAARGHSAVGVLPQLLTQIAMQNVDGNRWVEAQARFDEAIRLARESGQRTILAVALSRYAWLSGRLGRSEQARALADEALAIAREQGVTQCEIWALQGLIELELVLGAVDAALARTDELQAVIERQGIKDADLFPAPERVEIFLRLGRTAEAEDEAIALADAAAAKGQPWALARAARCTALLAEPAAIDDAFGVALELHERTRDVFETARTELAYGARLRRAGRRADARIALQHAIDIFDGFGAAPWSELARAEYEATGETARRRAPSSLDELTPQELQIALLLADGRTTREAAASMFLSPKTIEYHLRNIYRKLAIHSRDELRDAVASDRLAVDLP